MLEIRLVLGKQPVLSEVRMQLVGSSSRMGAARKSLPRSFIAFDPRLRVIASPAPGVSKPKGRQHMDRCGVGAHVTHSDSTQQILRRGLGVFDVDIEVSVIREDAGVPELKFRLCAGALAVLFDQRGVGKLGMRILVVHPHVAVRWRAIEIEESLLHILAVVTLRAGQAKHSLLENRIPPIPEGVC